MNQRRKIQWIAIFEELKMDVESGTLATGQDYPSESELIDRFGVSRTTIRRVLSELFKAGFVNIRPGKRREVIRPTPVRYAKVPMNDPSSEESFGQHLKSIARSLRWLGEDRPYDKVIVAPQRVPWYGTSTEPRLPPNEVRRSLGLGEEDQIIWLMRTRNARRSPLVLQWVVVPVSLVPAIRHEDLQPGGLTAVYQNAGITRQSYSSTFMPTGANSAEARYLQVESGTPLIEERRISRCRNGKRLVVYELLVTLYSDRIRLEFDWGGAESDTSHTKRSTNSTRSKQRGAVRRPAVSRKRSKGE